MGKIKVKTSSFFFLFPKAWKPQLIGAVLPMEHDKIGSYSAILLWSGCILWTLTEKGQQSWELSLEEPGPGTELCLSRDRGPHSLSGQGEGCPPHVLPKSSNP